MALHVPHVDENTSNVDAALAYAAANWFVLPVRYGSKNPGSVVGGKWQELSTRDPEQIRAWWTDTNYGIALHVGKSGGIVVDLDNPEKMPDVLQRAIDELHPPYQSTRRGDTGRGHFLFDAGGVDYTNSIGQLPPGFGDIRGKNGVILVSPSVHEKHAEGGFYHWNVTGPVPKVPQYVAELLTEAGETAEQLSNKEADTFITTYDNEGTHPHYLDKVLRKFEERLETGDSRHEVLKKTLPWALREAVAGFYSAAEVYTQMRERFITACMSDKMGSGAIRGERESGEEFDKLFKWAAAQSLLQDPEETRNALLSKMVIPGPKQVTEDDERWLDVVDYEPDPKRWLHFDMLNDTGNAMRLADLLADRIRYVEGAGWHVWNGKVWLSDGEKFPNVHEMIRRANQKLLEDRDAIRVNGGEVPSAIEKHIHYSLSSAGLKNCALELSKTYRLRWTADQVDAHPDLLTVRNGVVDLRTGELRPHDPMLGLTKILDVDYDETAEAPRWELFMKEIFPNHGELVDFMQRLIGYGVTGHVSEHAMAIFYGRGRNGKSVFLNTLDYVFSAVSSTADWTTFERQKGAAGGTRSDLVRLRGARLVHVSEGNAGSLIDEAKLKQVVAGDPLTVRGLYQSEITFDPSFLLMMATNAKPDFQGADDGLWERVKLIPFEAYFGPDQRDPGLTDKLRSEAQGILAWAVRGAMEWYQKGLQEPDVVKQATREYRDTSDSLFGFLGEESVFVVDSDGRVESSKLYEKYKQWADHEGLVGKDVWTLTRLGREMEGRGFSSGKSGGKRVRWGISLNLEHELNGTEYRTKLGQTTAVDGTEAVVHAM